MIKNNDKDEEPRVFEPLVHAEDSDMFRTVLKESGTNKDDAETNKDSGD